MKFIIITGLSGAGKSKAIGALEDIGYYCVDNIPPALIKNFTELCKNNKNMERAALVIDVRGREYFEGLALALNELERLDIEYKILFLEAAEDVLSSRYKETRRKHPFQFDTDLTIDEAIANEVQALSRIRSQSDYIIDTTLLSPAQLKERINDMFLDAPENGFKVHCMSFGFKYGPVTDSDLMFDVRCLPNPYYIDDLRLKTGLDNEVSSYVLSNATATTMLKKIIDLIDYLIPLYEKEGKSQLNIAFGCTGGKHRSVTFAEYTHGHLLRKDVCSTVSHRDIRRHG